MLHPSVFRADKASGENAIAHRERTRVNQADAEEYKFARNRPETAGRETV